jgi:hypothetical protein
MNEVVRDRYRERWAISTVPCLEEADPKPHVVGLARVVDEPLDSLPMD